MKLTIDRSKWANPGLDNGSSMLLNSDGGMCCLGFACIAAGVPEEEIFDRGEPEGLDVAAVKRAPDGWSSLLWHIEEADYSPAVVGNSKFARAAIRINDDVLYTQAEREEKLIKLFADNGVELEFTGVGKVRE